METLLLKMIPIMKKRTGLDLVPTIFDLLGEYAFLEEHTPIDGKTWLTPERSMENRFLVIDSPPTVLPERLKKYPKLQSISIRCYQ